MHHMPVEVHAYVQLSIKELPRCSESDRTYGEKSDQRISVGQHA